MSILGVPVGFPLYRSGFSCRGRKVYEIVLPSAGSGLQKG